MSAFNKVVWSEGLFLRPQHMQQQDRYIERYVELRAATLRPHPWGFDELELERDLLAIGKLGIRSARGVFPDGTPFSMPDRDPLPPPLDIDGNWRDQVVYLTLPLRSPTQAESLWPEQAAPGQLSRFAVREAEVNDASGSTSGTVVLEVGGLAARLAVASQPREGLVELPLAHLVECRADRRVVLDEGFIPSALSSRASQRLTLFLTELLGLLHQRGEALAGRVAGTDRTSTAELADFLMLQLVNRHQPVLAHLAEAPLLHPEELYRLLLGMAGELATFTAPGKRAEGFPPYRHERLRVSFDPVFASLRASLSAVLEQTAISVPLQQRKFGVWVGTVPDPTLLDGASFVLAAKADIPAADMRRRLPTQSKIGPVEKIRDLVNLQLPGIAVASLPVAPRQIPYQSGYQYFELDTRSPMWKTLRTSGGVALHFGNGFDGLALELWAVRN
ncbi:type VI secretion system baseplate subunit TssK [Luteibacter aegosomatis]|uniref:type VI secretion system baseplate subunit TssK n=1 Tax=Luteibacter aegosomatis TaxID=2911537 RepID=UPI001FFB0AB1|nr:type VI secretion system baseplate subunit TssK [Luteibacter aegosomatis]UPG84791.1 type VI secretion system baseplate subunit TssK [Luteibacter aegosomatis]